MLLSHMLCIYCLLCVYISFQTKKLNTYRVGRERSQEDSVESFIERCRTFFSEKRCQDINQTPVLPFCSYKHRHAQPDTYLTEQRRVSSGSFSPVWKLDLRTSGGRAMVQFKIPAMPPARRILGVLRWVTLKQGNKYHLQKKDWLQI